MALQEYQLRVKDLPPQTTKNRLRLLFQNKKRQGGGPVKDIELFEDCNSAIITFEEKEAVQTILQRGNQVEINSISCTVSSFSNHQSEIPQTPISKENSKVTPLEKATGQTEDGNDKSGAFGQTKNPSEEQSFVKNATIQISVNNNPTDVDPYTVCLLYLHDKDFNKGKFFEDKIFMDGLHNIVYVPFHRSEDAQKLCNANLKNESCIQSIGMADVEVFNHYTNRLSIHGADFSSKTGKDKLKKFVKKKTGLNTIDIISSEEPLSAVIIFDEKVVPTTSKLYSVARECMDKMEDSQLVTAPVRISSTILVNVHGTIDKSLLEKYFKNKNLSGGGPIKDISSKEHGSFLVTFVLADDTNAVVKKNDHKVGSIKLDTSLWYHCLSKEACIPKEQKENPSSSGHGFSPRKICSVKSGPHDSFESFDLELKKHEYSLITRIDNLFSCESLSNEEVKLNDNTHTITITGSNKFVNNTKNNIHENLATFVAAILDFPDHHNFLSRDDVLKKINETFHENKVLAYVNKENEKLFCFKQIKAETNIMEMMKDDVNVASYSYEEQKIMALECDRGRRFIKRLIADSKTPCEVTVNSDKREVEIITFETKSHQLRALFSKIEKFMTENAVFSTNLIFPDLQFKYALDYLGKEVKSITKELEDSGASVKIESGSILIKGFQSAITKAEQKLCPLRESIRVQEEELKYFGIFEHLSSNDGTSMLCDIGKKHKCLLQLCDITVADGASSQPSSNTNDTLIGTCQVDKVKVSFVLGDITSLNANVIVNPIDNKLKCEKGLNKVIVQNGGAEIQQELNSYKGNADTGTVIKTQGGKLHYSAIYHLILQKDDDANNLLTYITECLKQADNDDHKSLALPVLGCGRFKMPLVGVSLSIGKALKKHCQSASSINEIVICDNNPVNLRGVMRRFDVKPIRSLDDLIKEDTPDEGSGDFDSNEAHHGKTYKQRAEKSAIKFGSLTLTMKQGDILQEKSDVIACGIKDNLELSSGGALSKAMLRMCGNSLQTECTQKAEEFSNEGVMMTSSNGLSCQAIMFVNMTTYSRNWDKGVEKVLTRAEADGHTSIALPVFGAGAKHANIPKLKTSILHAIKNFGKSVKTLNDVRLVIFDKNILHSFQDNSHRERGSRPKVYKSPGGIVPKPVSRNARVNVVFQNPDDGIKAVKELKETCDKAFKKHIVKIEGIRNMSPKEINELMTIGLRKQVHISIEKETDSACLTTFEVDSLVGVMEEIHKYVMDMKVKITREDSRLVETAFKWQFMSNGRWRDFEPETNCEIEKAFKKSQDSVEFEDTRHRKYVVKFNTMKEYRIKGTDLQEIATINRYDLRAGTIELPKCWDKMENGENLKVVDLSDSSQEYKNVESCFKSGGANAPIKKIQRIQNVMLYQQYASKKNYFEKTNPKGTENEKKLFHGTDPNAVANINASGFNRSFCGKNATAYGMGVYFAVNSSYSVGYATPDPNGNKLMYLARVLVGVSTPSNSSMKYLPNKPGTNVPYDSGAGPSMFIIFHDCQAYPEYLIAF